MAVSRRTLVAGAVAIVVALPGQVFGQTTGQLVYEGAISTTGTGFGNVATVLTLQNHGTEAGCIGPSGAAGCSTGDMLPPYTGGPHNNLYAIGQLPGLTGSNLNLVLNFTEPQAAKFESGTLDFATLTLYNGTTPLFSASTTGSQTFSETNAGIGKPDYVFGLSPSSAAIFDSFLQNPGSSSYTLGLSASISDAQGGPDTFYLAYSPSSVTTTPEPSSMALVGTGLVGLVPIFRRRRA